jgi:ketosteroid isomerase-like protein
MNPIPSRKGRTIMNRLLSLLTASLLLTHVAISQTTEQKIADYEAALGQAMIHKDVATLSKLVGDDWTIQNDTGSTGTKAGFIDDVKSGTLVVTAFRLHDLHVHVLGNVAFVQGFDDEESSYKGTPSNGTYNWMDVWVNRNGQWVSVATQLTRVQTKK